MATRGEESHLVVESVRSPGVGRQWVAAVGVLDDAKGERGMEAGDAEGVAGVDDAILRWTSDSTSSRLDCCKETDKWVE